MSASPLSSPAENTDLQLTRVARFEGMRALAWSGDLLYASRGYDLFCARVSSPNFGDAFKWERIGSFRPALRRRMSVMNRFSSRLFRDGFHALAVTSSGAVVAAVPGAIIALRPGESQFRVTFPIARGTRPLHIAAIPNGNMYWGEYFDNAARDQVHIYSSTDAGLTWTVAHTFAKGSIRHVHNVVYDRWADCLWILTGDYEDECRILRASCDFKSVESVLQGNQQARAVALALAEDALYFSTDTPLELNYVYRLDRRASLVRLAPLTSSSIYGCGVGKNVFFSTMVEPSKVNRDINVRIFAGRTGEVLRPLLSWQKDAWPMRFFQYGNAFLPDGDNQTNYLAVTTVAVKTDDCALSLYSVEG